MTFNPTEKHQSQIPALQLLVALGFTPLSQHGGPRPARRTVSAMSFWTRSSPTSSSRSIASPTEVASTSSTWRMPTRPSGASAPTPTRRRVLRGTNQEVYRSARSWNDHHAADRRGHEVVLLPVHRLGGPGQQRLSRDRRDGGRAHRKRQDSPLRCGRVRERDPLRRRREQATDGEVGEGRKPADRIPERGEHPAPLPFRAAPSRPEPPGRSVRHGGNRRQVLAGLAD